MFVGLIGGAAVTWPLAARAQQARMARIGILLTANPEPFWSLFLEGMRGLGYSEGRTVQCEIRRAEGNPTPAARLCRGACPPQGRCHRSLTDAVRRRGAARHARHSDRHGGSRRPSRPRVYCQSGAAGGQHHRHIRHDCGTRTENTRACPRHHPVRAAHGRAGECA